MSAHPCRIAQSTMLVKRLPPTQDVCATPFYRFQTLFIKAHCFSLYQLVLVPSFPDRPLKRSRLGGCAPNAETRASNPFPAQSTPQPGFNGGLNLAMAVCMLLWLVRLACS
jgi:hypothetical protein